MMETSDVVVTGAGGTGVVGVVLRYLFYRQKQAEAAIHARIKRGEETATALKTQVAALETRLALTREEMPRRDELAEQMRQFTSSMNHLNKRLDDLFALMAKP